MTRLVSQSGLHKVCAPGQYSKRNTTLLVQVLPCNPCLPQHTWCSATFSYAAEVRVGCSSVPANPPQYPKPNEQPFCMPQRSVWDPPQSQPTHRSTLDLMPLNTYPSLITYHSANLTHHTSSLAGERSQDYSSYSGAGGEEAWAARQGAALQGMRSADFNVPYGSSPERVRIMQDDYRVHGPSKYAA